MNNYRNALVEVDSILEHLNEEEFQKIPLKIINAIKKNKNPEYKYNYDNSIELKDQSMCPETKAILFNIFRDYLSTQEQKEKIIIMQNKDRIKVENIKVSQIKQQSISEQYNPDDIFKNRTKNKNNFVKSDTKNIVAMTEYKESLLSKLINKIKRLFHIN